MTAATYMFNENRGAMWRPVFRWGSDVLVSIPVTAITKACPPVITAANHGVPSGWPAALTGVQGMTQINSANFPPRGSDYTQATVVDVNTVNFNKIDASNFSTYLSGGYLVYPTPVDLSAVTAMVMTVYDNADLQGTPVATLAVGTGITLDNVAKTITAQLDLSTLTGDAFYFKLIGTTGGVPTEILYGTLLLTP